jgi:hypothetical protein
MRIFLSFAVMLVASVASRSVRAQAELVPVESPKGVDQAAAITGWNPFFTLTAGANLISNDNVIGQVDGTSTTLAGGLNGGAEYIQGQHYVGLTGLINEGFTHTPVVSRFVKSNDVFKLDGIYNYFLTPNLGLYARASFATSFFPGEDVRGTPTSWIDVTNPMAPILLNQNSLEQRLADPFKPLTVTESVGGFADPIRKEEFGLAFRLGIGGRTTLANGTYVPHANPADTTDAEVVELSDVEQLGLEGFAGTSGKLQKGDFQYKAGVAVLLPFVNNDSYNRSAAFLTRVAFEADLTYKFSKWLSAVYSLTVTRDPQLFPNGQDEVQVQNTLLLTFSLNLLEKREAPKPKTNEQLEVEAAKAAEAAAEARAADAEAKLKAIENTQPSQPTNPTTPATPGVSTPPTPPTP